MHRLRRLSVLLAACGLLAGCGAEGTGSDNVEESNRIELNEQSAGAVADAREQIELLCREGGAEPTELGPAVDAIAGVHADFPQGVFESGDVGERLTMRQVVIRAAQQLRECGADDLAQQLLVRTGLQSS